jgi:hypothetical protein
MEGKPKMGLIMEWPLKMNFYNTPKWRREKYAG